LKKGKLTEQMRTVLQAITATRVSIGPERGTTTTADIVVWAVTNENLTRTSVSKKLEGLVKKGLVIRVSRGVYRLAKGVRA
jgi:predicted transcriptional regulator of viral defense system